MAGLGFHIQDPGAGGRLPQARRGRVYVGFIITITRRLLLARCVCFMSKFRGVGLPRDQFSGPWLFSTAEARTSNFYHHHV